MYVLTPTLIYPSPQTFFQIFKWIKHKINLILQPLDSCCYLIWNRPVRQWYRGTAGDVLAEEKKNWDRSSRSGNEDDLSSSTKCSVKVFGHLIFREAVWFCVSTFTGCRKWSRLHSQCGFARKAQWKKEGTREPEGVWAQARGWGSLGEEESGVVNY